MMSALFIKIIFCRIIRAHFLIGHEYIAICIWLLYETLSKAQQENQEGLTKEDVFRCAMCFQSVYSSSPET